MEAFPHERLDSGAEAISQGLPKGGQDLGAQASACVVECECCQRSLIVSMRPVAAMVVEVAGDALIVA